MEASEAMKSVTAYMQTETAPLADPESPVDQALARLQGQLNVYREFVGILAGKLSPVLGAGSPEVAQPLGQDYPGNCMLTKRVMDMAEQLTEQNGSLSTIIDRLEV